MIGDKFKIRSRYNQMVSFEGYLLKKLRGGMQYNVEFSDKIRNLQGWTPRKDRLIHQENQ
jgi:hypothetical protein